MALLVGAVLSVLLPLLALFANPESPVPVGLRLMAAGLWIASTLPLALYLRTPPHERRPIPFIQVVGLLYAFYYALGPMLGLHDAHYKVVVGPVANLWPPMLFATVGWIILLLSYRLTTKTLSIPRLFVGSINPEKFAKRWGIALMALGIVLQTGFGQGVLPATLNQLVRVTVLIGWASAAAIVYLIARKQTSRTLTLVGIGGVVVIFFLNATSGVISPAARFSVLIGIAYVLGRGRVPWKLLPTALALVILLITMRGVISDYRALYWFSDADKSVDERVVLMADLLGEQVEQGGVEVAIAQGAEASYGRSANLELFADVVRRTPEEVPYWRGQTYLSLAGAFVPRLLWPDKPTKEVGQAFGHRYHYVDPNDRSTSFNLPSLVEFYVNFGEWGVYLGMVVLGMVYGVANQLVNKPGQPIIATLFGFILLLPLFNLESDFSLTVGGLFLTGAFLFLIYRQIQGEG